MVRSRSSTSTGLRSTAAIPSGALRVSERWSPEKITTGMVASRRVGAQLGAELPAVHHGHHQVEEDERLRRLRAQALQRFLAVPGGGRHLEALAAEERAVALDDVVVVVDDHHPPVFAGAHAGPSGMTVDAPRRGSVIVKVVPSPAWLCTVILPKCAPRSAAVTAQSPRPSPP